MKTISLPLSEYNEHVRTVKRAASVLALLRREWPAVKSTVMILLQNVHQQHNLSAFIEDVNRAQESLRLDITNGKVGITWIKEPDEADLPGSAEEYEEIPADI